MEILGIGPSELIFIIIIALIVLGPKDMQKAGRTIGRWLNQLVKSDGWRAFQRTTTELRNLPTHLMREANQELNEINKDIQKNTGPSPFAYPTRPPQPATSQPTTLLRTEPAQSQEADNSIQPPSSVQTAILGSESDRQTTAPVKSDTSLTEDGDGSIQNQNA